MTDKPPAPTRTEKPKAAQSEREARLAAALRENLRRRKQQGRAREAGERKFSEDR